MTDKDRALLNEIRQIARMPKGHGFKRRKAESHRKVWGFPALSIKTRALRGQGKTS